MTTKSFHRQLTLGLHSGQMTVMTIYSLEVIMACNLRTVLTVRKGSCNGTGYGNDNYAP